MAGGPDRDRLRAEARATEEARRRAAARESGLGRVSVVPAAPAPVLPAVRRRNRPWLVGLVGLLLLAVLAAGAFLLLRPGVAGPAATSAGPFPLSVETLPAGATVTLMSDATRQVVAKARGPLAIFSLPQGAYSAFVASAGFRPLRFKVILPGNARIRAYLNATKP